MAVERCGELGADKCLKRFKKILSCLGNTTSDDDSMRIQKPAGVNDGAGEFLCDTAPDIDSDGVTALCC